MLLRGEFTKLGLAAGGGGALDRVGVELLSVLGAHDVGMHRVGARRHVLRQAEQERDQHEQRRERSPERELPMALMRAQRQRRILLVRYTIEGLRVNQERPCSETAGAIGATNAASPLVRAIDLADSVDLYQAAAGEFAIVKITYTGSRGADFTAAWKESRISGAQRALLKKDYTWHHVGDYNAGTNSGSLQLVKSDGTHKTTGHCGGGWQYQQATGKKCQ